MKFDKPIALAADHGGFELKEAVKAHLTARGMECVDFGTFTKDSCDYPDFARPAAEAVASGACERGIVLCTTGIGVSHGRGVILLAIERAGVPLFEYTPMQVKQAVVGYGSADKHQVMEMTRRILHMEKVAQPDDAADAVACAITHAHAGAGREHFRIK